MSGTWVVTFLRFEQYVGCSSFGTIGWVLKFQDYCIVANTGRSYAFILFPNDVAAESLRTRYVSVGNFKFFFDLVKGIQKMPFFDDINQHLRVSMWV